jgi:hypothetical protein
MALGLYDQIEAAKARNTINFGSSFDARKKARAQLDYLGKIDPDNAPRETTLDPGAPDDRRRIIDMMSAKTALGMEAQQSLREKRPGLFKQPLLQNQAQADEEGSILRRKRRLAMAGVNEGEEDY